MADILGINHSLHKLSPSTGSNFPTDATRRVSVTNSLYLSAEEARNSMRLHDSAYETTLMSQHTTQPTRRTSHTSINSVYISAEQENEYADMDTLMKEMTEIQPCEPPEGRN